MSIRLFQAAPSKPAIRVVSGTSCLLLREAIDGPNAKNAFEIRGMAASSTFARPALRATAPAVRAFWPALRDNVTEAGVGLEDTLRQLARNAKRLGRRAREVQERREASDD